MIKDGLNVQEGEIRSYLLIGQSNMAGRGTIGDVPPIKNKNCLMLRMGRWQKMSEPINPDRSIFEGSPRSGICLAASFADEMANDFERLLCEICANEDTYIHAVVHNTHTNHLIVVIPFNKHFYKYNAIYSYANQELEYLTTIN